MEKYTRARPSRGQNRRQATANPAASSLRLTTPSRPTTSTPSQTIRQAYHVELSQKIHRQHLSFSRMASLIPNSSQTLTHVSGPPNGGKRQYASSFRLTSFLSINHPLPPLLGCVRFFSSPFQSVRPQLVRYPVALPIIRSRIYQDSNPPFQQTSNVELGWDGVLVHVSIEIASDFATTRRQVGRCLHTKDISDFWSVKVVRDNLILKVT